MIPICLVTGFLGSGKTTFLQHVASLRADERIVYLINEFSPQDVDGVLLEEVQEDVVAVPGGSIFCKCLVTQFAGNLKMIPERFDTEEEPLEGVVIEASGVANPMVIEQLLSDTGLDEVYDLTKVVSVVDPESLPKLVQTLPNMTAQVEAADVVLLNKIDLFGTEEIAQAEQIVREINVEAPVIRTVRCALDIELFAGGRERGLKGEYAPCADPNYARFAVSFEGPVDVYALVAQLKDLRDEIYRAKGFVPTSEGVAYVDMSPAEVSVRRAPQTEAPAGLSIIARGDAAPGVQELVERLSKA
jgi:G3E family GTPase